MHAFLLSTALVFAAELGDKSQLLALTLAARYRFWPVLAGITLATASVHLASVALGSALGEALPRRPLTIAAGVAFLAFALWTSQDRPTAPPAHHRFAVLVVAGAFALAELGDKTMLATVALATQHPWLGTWLGSTLGMVAADALAVLVGAALGARLPAASIRYGGALALATFGILLLVQT